MHSVLVVEDNEDIRELLRALLELEGYAVVTAANGHQGLERLRAMEHPSAILLDLMMPVMSGEQFLQIKNLDPELAAVPVIVVTAGFPPRELTGAQEVVRKPLDFEILRAKLHDYCSAS